MRNLLLHLFSHRTLASLRWDLYMLRLRFKNWITRQSVKLRRFMETRQSPVYLNLGSGPRGLDDSHWLNVDACHDRNVHFLLDFNRPFPLDSNSIDGVFSEHVLEHFSLEEGTRLMTQIHRILKPAGVVRLIVPDAAWVMKKYFDEPEGLIQHRMGQSAESGNISAMQVVNDYFRQGYHHHFLYDSATMTKALKAAGFSEVRVSSYRQSSLCPDLVLDDPKYSAESLYVEARK